MFFDGFSSKTNHLLRAPRQPKYMADFILPCIVLYCIESTSALQPRGRDPHAGFACATHHSVHHHLISLVEKSKGGGDSESVRSVSE